MNNAHRRCINNGCQRIQQCEGVHSCELNAEASAPFEAAIPAPDPALSAIDHLLMDLDMIARERDQYEYGLPIDCTATDGPMEDMRRKVRRFLERETAAIPAPEGAQAVMRQALEALEIIAAQDRSEGFESGKKTVAAITAIRAALAAPAPQDSLDSAQPSKGVAMQAPQAPAWQPIETAPKERGGLVDIICNERRYTGCHYDRICDEYRHITACGVLIRLKGATHWMPIPAAPQTKEPKA